MPTKALACADAMLGRRQGTAYHLMSAGSTTASMPSTTSQAARRPNPITAYSTPGATMPTINIQLFEGRTIEQKRAFAEAVTKVTVDTLGGTAAGVQVIFTDVKRENWATGGRLASDPPKG